MKKHLGIRAVKTFVRPILALLACSLAGFPPPPAAAQSGPPVDIPVILPLTGPVASVGQSEQQSFQVLERDVNATGGIRNRPLHFVFSDDQGNPQVAVQLYRQAAAAHPPIIFGGAFSGPCKATAPVAEQEHDVVFYCLSTAIKPTPGGYVFTCSYHPNDLMAKGLAYFKSKGLTRVAVLVGIDATGQEVTNNMQAMLAEPQLKGIDVVLFDAYDPQTINIAAQMSKIEAARPQALAVWSAAGVQTVLRALKESGLDIPVVMTGAFQVYDVMAAWKDILPKHLYFPAGAWTAYFANQAAAPGAIGRFFEAFRKAGVRPDGGSELGWDAGLIVVDGLRKIGPNATAKQLHDYIEGVHGFDGTNGTYDFRSHDQRGVSLATLVLTEWSPDKGTWIPAQ